jgi:hypothetical protein
MLSSLAVDTKAVLRLYQIQGGAGTGFFLNIPLNPRTIRECPLSGSELFLF